MGSDKQNTGSLVLTDPERKALEWAYELMGDCEGRDTLKAMVERLNTSEAEAASLREALEKIDKWWVIPGAQEAGTGDDSSTPKETALRKAVENARDLAASALSSTTSGKALLDEVARLRDENTLLSQSFKTAHERARRLEEQVERLTKERDLLVKAIGDARSTLGGLLDDILPEVCP